MSARADDTARRGRTDNEPRASARPPFQKRPNKIPHCPDCLGRGWPVDKQYQDEQGRTVSLLAKDPCERCGGTGNLGDKTRGKTGGLSAESLGKLGGMDVTRWPVSRRRAEEP